LAELLRAEGFDIPDTAIVTGLETVSHPGRLELVQHQPAFLIDGAHNPAGAESLRAYLEEFAPQPLTLVFGAMRDKQLEQIGEVLFPCAGVLILTTINNPRSATIERLREIADRFARGRVLTSESSAAALNVALAETPPEGLICIAGSLYLVGELRPLIMSLS
jgi:dihydrofolate synthase/folylpolyglutamate synthase